MRVFACFYALAFNEMDGFIQDTGVSRCGHVAADGQGQPEIIIGATRTNATARWGMPPVLDIAFMKLTPRANEQVVAHKTGLCIDKRHHVLQLIGKAEGASRLIETAARP